MTRRPAQARPPAAPSVRAKATPRPAPPAPTGRRSSRRSAGSLWTDPAGLRWRYVPPGRFQMGSLPSEAGHARREAPRHEVSITRGFWIMEAPVTQALYEEVTGGNPSRFKRSGQHPVERVSWNDAVSFCRKLARRWRLTSAYRGDYDPRWVQEASGPRLPTEAEWEYAARAGTTTRWSFGDADGALSQYAWCRENSERRSHPVGQKASNPWHLVDVHGNVSEWCWDVYDAYPDEPQEDPVGPDGGGDRVIRGGAWSNAARNSRSANRGRARTNDRRDSLGFRLVLPLGSGGG